MSTTTYPTLRDLMIATNHAGNLLYDSDTGMCLPELFNLPKDYAVLCEPVRLEGMVYAAVRGPSGKIDVYGPAAGQMHLDALAWVEELPQWVEENYTH